MYCMVFQKKAKANSLGQLGFFKKANFLEFGKKKANRAPTTTNDLTLRREATNY